MSGRLYEAGDFDRMELVIRRRLDDPCVPEALKARLRVQMEMAYEIPRAYPYTRAQMLDILQKNVSGFAEEELETLRDDGTLDWRYVNGEVRFKNNALSALLKTRKEYAMRATDPAVMSGTKASAEPAERDDCQNEGERRRARAVRAARGADRQERPFDGGRDAAHPPADAHWSAHR